MEPNERPPSKESQMLYLEAMLSVDNRLELTKEDYNMLNTIPLDQLSENLRDKLDRYNATVEQSAFKHNT